MSRIEIFFEKTRFSVLSYVFFSWYLVSPNGKDRIYNQPKLPSSNEYRYFSPTGAHLVWNMDIWHQPASIWCGIWIFSINRHPSGVEYEYLALIGVRLV